MKKQGPRLVRRKRRKEEKEEAEKGEGTRAKNGKDEKEDEQGRRRSSHQQRLVVQPGRRRLTPKRIEILQRGGLMPQGMPRAVNRLQGRAQSLQQRTSICCGTHSGISNPFSVHVAGSNHCSDQTCHLNSNVYSSQRQASTVLEVKAGVLYLYRRVADEPACNSPARDLPASSLSGPIHDAAQALGQQGTTTSLSLAQRKKHQLPTCNQC
eukprot:2471935-Amphidinium_carterae.1